MKYDLGDQVPGMFTTESTTSVILFYPEVLAVYFAVNNVVVEAFFSGKILLKFPAYLLQYRDARSNHQPFISHVPEINYGERHCDY